MYTCIKFVAPYSVLPAQCSAQEPQGESLILLSSCIKDLYMHISNTLLLVLIMTTGQPL